MFNIVDYGAVADGVSLNTAAIQSAIDACYAAGGGRVFVPSGIFKTGTIWLKSGVELHLSIGATLLASDNIDDYNDDDAYEQNFGVPFEYWRGKHLIIAHEIENVAITGLGTVDGNCYAFVDDDFENPQWFRWRAGSFKCKDMEKLRPGQLIVFIECKHVTVRDITVKNSGCWSVFLHGCEYVSVRGYKVFNPINMLNSDGLDIDNSRYVTVSDCIIHSGDDGITVRCDGSRLKNKNIHSEYITITNCTIHSGICAFRFGVGVGKIAHVTVSNITVSRCRELMQFCTAYLSSGCACIEDVHISGISATDTDRMISMFANNGAYIKDVTIENVRSEACSMSYIHQNDGTINNVMLSNVDIMAFDRYDHLDDDILDMRGRYIFSIRNAKGVILNNVRIFGDFKQKSARCEMCGCDDAYMTDCKL
jgi:polygalacturonase